MNKVDENKTNKFQGGLYPTIAISDVANCIGHLIATKIAFEKGNILASCGFFSVAFAAFIGVFRFGFSESLLASLNHSLADLAAFVGLPLVGLSFIDRASHAVFQLDNIVILSLLVLIEAISRNFNNNMRELSKTIINALIFIIPIAFKSYQINDIQTLGAISLFAFSAVIITPDHHKCILGVRCVNWFHYAIGIAAVYIALAL